MGWKDFLDGPVMSNSRDVNTWKSDKFKHCSSEKLRQQAEAKRELERFAKNQK